MNIRGRRGLEDRDIEVWCRGREVWKMVEGLSREAGEEDLGEIIWWKGELGWI